MKLLTIERPEKLSLFDRHIAYFDPESLVDMRAMNHRQLNAVKGLTSLIGGGPAACGNYAKAAQIMDGVLLIVDQRVSRDLEVSTVAGDLDRLAWPADSVEMRFQDPSLPTVILSKVSIASNPDAPAFRGDAGRSGIIAVTDGKGGSPCYTLAIPNDLWPQYAVGDWTEDMKARHYGDLPLESGETDAMRYLTVLAVKVLAYSSVPQLAPQLLTTRAEQKAAGLHPKHVTPGQRTLVVRYLPRIVREHVPVESEPTGKTHRFLGRAGCIRHYQSDRFKTMKGQWQWIAPIPPPEGVAITYRIRQAPKGSVPITPNLLTTQ